MINKHAPTLNIPQGYKPLLNLKETENAIKKIKDCFEHHLASALNLIRVSAPLLVTPGSGLNDNLNGIEKPVAFNAKGLDNEKIEIVQSLAKWKRMALFRYGFSVGEGLYTDMNAIRCDEELDNTHSIYVDQWDWEKIIPYQDRTLDTLKSTVQNIFQVFKDTEA
ncbi:MAG: aspartate--ammonia ligase, partial [bacterium]|nr:aspartate--ammonia ligase [bacterium]